MLTKYGLVLPGDKITETIQLLKCDEDMIIYGPGLTKSQCVIRPGLLYSNITTEGQYIFWVETHSKKYHDPVSGDIVLGVVVQRLTEYFRVDIGTSELALLPMLAFQGATKRSKPDIYPGDLVVCEITEQSKSSSTEILLTCVNERTGKSDGLGVITGGGSIERPGVLSGMVAATTVVQSSGLARKDNKKHTPSIPEKQGQTKKGSDCDGFAQWFPLALCRRLLMKNSKILIAVGKNISFEIAIGMNGLVWLNGGTIDKTMMIFNVIEKCEFIPDEEVISLINAVYL